VSSVALVPPCYSSSGDNPAANNMAGAQVPCDPAQSDCVDTNGTPCAASSSAAVANALAIVNSSPGASNASQTGALSSVTNTSGPSLTSLFASLGQIGANTYAQTQAPSNTVKIGASGISIPGGSAGTMLLVAAVAIGVGFLYFAGKKKRV
jgi:hypothetical protein